MCCLGVCDLCVCDLCVRCLGMCCLGVCDLCVCDLCVVISVCVVSVAAAAGGGMRDRKEEPHTKMRGKIQ